LQEVHSNFVLFNNRKSFLHIGQQMIDKSSALNIIFSFRSYNCRVWSSL